MKSFLAVTITTTVLAFVIAPNLIWADVTDYTIDNYAFQDGTTLSGSIRTDGNTGALSLSDIDTYSITVTPPSSAAFTLSPANSLLRLNNLNADTSNLYLSPVIFSYFTIYNPSILLLDYEDYYPVPLVDDSFSAYAQSGSPTLFSSTPDQGPGAIGADPMIIASAAPEPSTIALLTLGALGLLARRRFARSVNHC